MTQSSGSVKPKSPAVKKIGVKGKKGQNNANSASKTNSSHKKKKMEKMPSFEKAVAQVRGLPDGADDDIDNSDRESDAEEQAMDISSPPPTTKSDVDKGKKKSQNILSKAAGKLKKGKDGKAGKKRKLSEKEEGEGDKKVKLEELCVKDRKKVRKMTKSNYVIAGEAKKLWEQLRKTDLTPQKRHETSGKLFQIIKGKTKELIYAHDTSRIIQCLMKYGAQEHKNALFEELKGEIVDMSKSKYAKFFVRKLLKYGTKDQRHHVFKSLYGNVRKLVRHKVAAEIIELAYSDYANVQQRQSLVEEFYGPSFALFKTPELRTLEQILASAPEKKESVLSNLKDSLTIHASKGIVQYSIVHKVFKDYFQHCSPQQTADMIPIARDSLIHMLHTNDGSEVARICIWNGNVKDRKAIIKSLKTYVVKVCKEEYGHLALLALLDTVDDTKLVNKAILEELLKSVDDVAKDQYGRKVLLYLLSPRDTKHFHPDIIKKLQTGDGNAHSKKDVSKRRSELAEYVSKPLIQYIATHCDSLVRDNSLLLLTLCIITHATCDPTEAMLALAKVASKPFSLVEKGEQEHIIESSAGNMTYKKLVQNDKERIKQNQVLFSTLLLDTLGKGQLKSWAACNRGCFLIIFLLELNDDDITKRVKDQLTGISSSLQKMDFKGAQILHTKLTAKSTSL